MSECYDADLRVGCASTQTFIHTTEPSYESFEQVENPDGVLPKPDGGLWTSTLRPEGNDSAWLEWCRREDYGLEDGSKLWLLKPEPKHTVALIDTKRDLELLVDRFGRDDAFGSQTFAPIDFEALAERYDGLRLTENGQRETHFSRPSLYGWDCESTLWFRWAFLDVECVGPVEEVIQDE